MPDIEQTLIDNYLLQKELLLQQFRSPDRPSPRLDRQRAAACIKPVIEKMARVAQGLDVPPHMLMEAAFAYAKSKRHPDGPFPNMLGSASYLTKALSYYFDVPAQIISERGITAFLLQRMDKRFEETIEALPVTADLFTASSFPAPHRILLALRKLDIEAVVLLAPDVLDDMSKDLTLSEWMSSKGCSYATLAAIYNKHKHNYRS